MKYYRTAMLYAMRKFIESLTNRYIEWLDDNQKESVIEKVVMQNFNAWIYLITTREE